MNGFSEKKTSLKIIARLYYASIFVMIISAILWVNKIEFAVLTFTIGASMMAIYYVIRFVNPPLNEQVDWSLVYPELAGLDVSDKE